MGLGWVIFRLRACAAAIGLKHLLHRRRSKKELDDVKAAHAGAHTPLLKL